MVVMSVAKKKFARIRGFWKILVGGGFCCFEN